MSWRARAEQALGISAAADVALSAPEPVREPDHGAVRGEAYRRGLEATGRVLPRGCAPAAWITGFERLLAAAAPAGCSARDWDTLLQGAEGFLRHWGAAAAEVGWTAEELFSLHPTAPFGRLDQRGVAFMVGAGQVTAVSADTIRLRSLRGTSDLTLHRRWLNPGPPAWEHFTNEEGSHG